MNSNNMALYRVLVKLGVADVDAESAASLDASLATKADIAGLQTEIQAGQLVTKADIAAFRQETRANISELKTELIKWNVGAIFTMTALFAAIVGMMKFWG